jgi:serine protease
MIVAYEPGVALTEAPGIATGASSVAAVALAPGDALGQGMRTVELSEAVTKPEAERIADQLTADTRVKWAEPDYFVPIRSTGTAYIPNDPYFASSTLWGLSGTYGIQAPAAWDVTRGSSSVVVAVVDTGGTAHPDAGVTVPGFDMIVDPAVANDGGGRDADPSDPGDGDAYSWSSWHGTHVAGTINAIANNGVGVVGVAPNVKVQHVRVLGVGGGYTSDIVAGITWASGGAVPGLPGNPTPASVINMSLGGVGACTADWQTAIDAAVARGTVVAVAAGNSNADAAGFSPASCRNVLTVAATDSAGKRASFSNYGSTVEIAAPGVGIMSTLNDGAMQPGNPSYASYSGTSMATPHVAGVVALMRSANPSLTPAQVTQLITSATNVTAFPGGACDATASKTCGVGIINAMRLLGAQAPITAPGVPTGVTATVTGTQASISWTAPTANGGSAITGYQARAWSAGTAGTQSALCSTSAVPPALPATTCTLTGLAAGTTVYVDVVAINAVGTGGPSTPRVAAVIPAARPGAPTNVKVTPGSQRLAVTWTAPSAGPVSSYRVRAWNASSGGSILGSCSATTTTACTVTSLANGRTVYVDVVAVNSFGTSPASTPRVAGTPATVPSAPRSVVATAGAQQVAVQWVVPSSNGGSAITGYQGRAWSASTGGTLIGSCQTTTTSCVIGGLTNSVTVYVDVVATNAVGTGTPSSPRRSARPAAAPAAVTAVTLSQAGGRLVVTWAPGSTDGGVPIAEYRVSAFPAATGGSPIRNCRTTGALTCSIDGLRKGMSVHVEVIAINAEGLASPASARAQAAIVR